MPLHVTFVTRNTMNTKHLVVGLTFLFALLTAHRSTAQANTFAEDFTGATTNHSWYFFNGACLTASSASVGTSPGQLPGCTAVKSAYYFGENLVGGTNGVSGSAQTLPDPANTGALRFTNGAPYGNNEGGAIVSATPFLTTNGVQVTFKSVTYRGDSGGGISDGADGISFFLIDGSTVPSIGSQGGSLAYTCSNPRNIPGHSIIDGVVGGYLGLGIDEYGNFLNASDNTASGWGQQGGRIGLRGAGNVAWSYLHTNYPGQYPSSLTAAQRQAAVAATCQSGYLWDYSTPSSPTPYLTSSVTTVIGTVSGVVTRGSSTITGIPNGSIPAGLVPGATITDPRGYIPNGTVVAPNGVGTTSITMSNQAARAAGNGGTAETFTFSSILPGGANIGIRDYPAIPGGYTVLSGVKIANESAMSRGAATPIFYNLKITPTGLLSLSYSLSGAAYQSILTNQDITAANTSGPMPSSFLFGFAGSTGGSTNIHEIMCFQAAATNTSGSSATVNENSKAQARTGTSAMRKLHLNRIHYRWPTAPKTLK